MNRNVSKLISIPLVLLASLSCGSGAILINRVSVAAAAGLHQGALPAFKASRMEQHYPQYVAHLKRFALANGISKTVVAQAFSSVQYLKKTIAADHNQPEKKMALNQYLAILASPKRLALAKQKLDEYHQAAMAAEKLTGVSAEYLIALWGIESYYGLYQGKEDVISTLVTLAFEGRRESFFVQELLATLKLMERDNLPKELLKGSWAGAMGQCQFMPSSLLAYGKDGDGDGKIDIWTNVNDVLSSIGNYLVSIGWDKRNPRWGDKVVLPDHFDIKLVGLNNIQKKLIDDWQRLGVKSANPKRRLSGDQLAWLIIPDSDKKSEGYLVYNNFKTIMTWNRSYSFAIGVGLIADGLMAR